MTAEAWIALPRSIRVHPCSSVFIRGPCFLPNMRPSFERFHRYDELTEILRTFARENPQLFSVESAGKSHEGRDIWIVAATNRATGAPEDKPAFWVDGN